VIRYFVAAPVATLLALALGGCELDQRWVDRHDARVRQAAEASWCDTGRRPDTGLTVIASSRSQACRNASDRRGYVARDLPPPPRRPDNPRPDNARPDNVHPESARPDNARPDSAHPLRGTPAVASVGSRKAPAPPVDEITQAASRTTIPIEVEQDVARQCLAECPALADAGTSEALVSYRGAVCRETCMVKNLPAASSNRDQYRKEAERDLDSIRRLHGDEGAGHR